VCHTVGLTKYSLGDEGRLTMLDSKSLSQHDRSKKLHPFMTDGQFSRFADALFLMNATRSFIFLLKQTLCF